jgi:hypothetical protein
VDLWRTIAEITGVSESLALANAPNAPATAPCLDSLSFLPLIEDPAGFVARPYAFSQTFTPAGPYDTTMCDPEEPLTNNLRSITKRVDGNLYKYIRYTRFDTLEPPCCPCQYATYDPADNDYVEQFYNVTTDPREIDDLMPQNAQHIDIFDPVLSPILRDLMNEMDSLSGT